MHWLYIFIAALFEVAWTFSLKYMRISALKSLRWDNFYLINQGMAILWPFVGYVLFGLGNVYFFAVAIKKIPMATAFAVWTAASMVVLKGCEILFYHDKLVASEVFFLLLIMVGIVGLKVVTN